MILVNFVSVDAEYDASQLVDSTTTGKSVNDYIRKYHNGINTLFT